MENSYEPILTTKISNEEESDKNYEIGISFSADKSYDNPDKKLSLSYSFDTHPVDEGFETVIQGGNESSSSHSSKLQSHEFDLSYSSPLNDKSKFELGYNFISRGDNSGTHKKEKKLWDNAKLNISDYSGKWYKETGSGMGTTINIASELNAYTLSDLSLIHI